MSATDRRQRIALLVCEDADGLHVEAHVPPQPEILPMPRPTGPPWHRLDRLTMAAVRLLARHGGWLTGTEIAERVDGSPKSDLPALLSFLARLEVVESSPKRGYMILTPPDRRADEYRTWLLSWLEEEEKRLPAAT